MIFLLSNVVITVGTSMSQVVDMFVFYKIQSLLQTIICAHILVIHWRRFQVLYYPTLGTIIRIIIPLVSFSVYSGTADAPFLTHVSMNILSYFLIAAIHSNPFRNIE